MTTALEEFRRISAVPRRSYHNEKILAYCMQRAKELGLPYYYDEKQKNLVIRRNASEGKEDRPGIVLQGHLDMVEQTDPGVVHDWEKDGLELVEEGDLLTARGTTLGADDGVAPAIAFALLSDETLSTPPLEVLLTTDEEVGMISVTEADLSYLQGDYLFNLDCGGEGNFVIGCCGGETLCVWVPFNREEALGVSYKLRIFGLNGGHSGMEIDKERANALKLLGEVLSEIRQHFDFRIKDLTAEGKDNAISKDVSCELLILSDHSPKELEDVIKKLEEKLRIIYRRSDANLRIELQPEGNGKERAASLDQSATEALAFLLYHLPFGVLNHDQSLDGSVETSCNIGLVRKEENRFGIIVSMRSSVEERRAVLKDHITSLARAVGADVDEAEKAYPAWLPDTESPLISIFSDMYKKMYGKEATVGPVHAGLECGHILSNSNLKAAIALGPDIYGEHTTNESLSISSLQRTFEFVKAVIESI